MQNRNKDVCLTHSSKDYLALQKYKGKSDTCQSEKDKGPCDLTVTSGRITRPLTLLCRARAHPLHPRDRCERPHWAGQTGDSRCPAGPDRPSISGAGAAVWPARTLKPQNWKSSTVVSSESWRPWGGLGNSGRQSCRLHLTRGSLSLLPRQWSLLWVHWLEVGM